MKGLSTYNTGKRDEGKELARQGLALDIKSHVCWHVNALIHRADREYVEALKCYTQANRVEPVRTIFPVSVSPGVQDCGSDHKNDIPANRPRSVA